MISTPRTGTANGLLAGSLALLLLGLALAAAPPAQAKGRTLPEVDRPGDVKPGTSALLTSPKGVRYFLRVPKKYEAEDGARLVVFLHGSSMNGLSYLRSFEAKRWAHDAILCCPNGEQGNGEPYGANNFTFESAPLVAEVTKEVQDAFNITVTYVGGHSQGGFLTYSVIMHFPELYQGAIPMAGDCWMQNEPNLWEDQPDRVELQKKVAIAVIHGQSDPVVKFAQGEHAYDVFRAMGYPKLRFFAPKHLGHQFMLSPVGEALEWLDAMNGREEKNSLKIAEKWARRGEFGWAFQTAETLLAMDPVGKLAKGKAPKLKARCETAAAKAAVKMKKAMDAKPPAKWIPLWLEFWRVHGATEAAKPLVEEYLRQRQEQRSTGTRLFQAARGHFQTQAKDAAHKKLEELLAEAPCTYEALYAYQWLEAD